MPVGVQANCLRKAAVATVNFSGREIAKLMASVQAAAYGTPNATLTTDLFQNVLELKLKQHHMRHKLSAATK
jgi:ATPase family AAA domain-containing protein 3A/B